MLNKEIDGKKLRTVAGAFATGITIITTEKEDGTIHGMTASSFQSISLEPALVAFCVKEKAVIFPLLKVGKRVGISILEANQKDISNQFAGFNTKELEVPMTQTKAGSMVINKALAWYCTIVNQIIPVGDHFFVLCAIQDLDRADDGQPLIYWSGYRTTGENI